MTVANSELTSAAHEDIFHFGGGIQRFGPSSRLCKSLDKACDLLLKFKPMFAVPTKFERRKVLIVGVEAPSRAGQLDAVTEKLRLSRHDVDVSTMRMKPQGKFANIEEAIAAAPRALSEYDWLIIVDDDVGTPPDFLDRYIALAEQADLILSQPAHCFASYVSYEVTRRRPLSRARLSQFVEIGPLTALHRRAFGDLIPFPPSRWCWGIDVLWSEIAHRNGWRMGIVDAVPIQHLARVAASYDDEEAVREARALLASHGVARPGRELLTSFRLF